MRHRTHSFPRLDSSLAFLALLATTLVLPQPALAATLTVNGQTGDSTPAVCDLVEAIENSEVNADLNPDCPGAGAYGDDTIELTVEVVLDTVDNTDGGLPLGLPRISGTLEIRGNGHAVRRDSGAPEFGLFSVLFGADLTIRDSDVRGGKLTGYPLGAGAGIHNGFGTLTLIDSTVRENAATFDGGVSLFGATATISASVISDNTATSSGGGIGLGGGSLATLDNSTVSGNNAQIGGGATVSGSTDDLRIDDSTVSGNSATGGGGGISSEGLLTITDSTLSGNSTTSGSGGGLLSTELATLMRTTVSGNTAAVSGGGIFNSGNVTIDNSTVSGNSATVAGGGLWNEGAATLTNATLAGNSAAPTSAGGIFTGIVGSNTEIGASLLARNGAGGNCGGAMIVDNGANLADDDTCGIPDTLTAADLDPALADNGGPTRTHALLPGSSAIDSAGACATATDQRGAGREGACDMGAFEFLNCDDLELDFDTVTNTQTRTSCQKIVVGPDFTVEATGDLTLRAGASIELGNGTSVETGGALALRNEGDLQIGNTVFVTSTTYTGDLDGPAGADAKCHERAAAAGLSGSFKAWLSSVNPDSTPAQTFTRSDAPYVRVDGVRIADDWSDLTDGSLQAAIAVDELGNPASFDNSWSATLTDGTRNPSVRDCLSWESSSGTVTGWMGQPYETSAAWTNWIGFENCGSSKTIYCFEQ